MPAVSFEKLFTRSPNPYMLLDRELRYVAVNDAYLSVTASRREDLIGRHIFQAFPDDPSDAGRTSTERLRTSLERVLERGEPDTIALIQYKVPRQTPEGVVVEDRYWSATHTPIIGDDGKVVYILQHTVDVTELQRLREARRQAQEAESRVPEHVQADVLQRALLVQEANVNLDAERRHLRRLFEQAPGFICFLRGPEFVFEISNKAYFQLVGHRDIIGKPVREALPEMADQEFISLLEQVFATGEPFVGRQMRALLQRESEGPLDEVYVDFVYQPVVDSDGAVTGIFVQGSDVTEEVRTQEELQRYREHLEDLVIERTRALEASEAALRQAQKMEAIGRLTGGVAHDFNNLLQVIAGNLQLLHRDVAGNGQAMRRVNNAVGAVERGARLASQLLAFARRQPLEPIVINVARLLRDMDDLLRRALGEHIELETIISGGLWNTLADPGQVENAVLNLAINARDAMNGEGKLTIEAGNAMLDDHYAALHAEVEPGQYVMLAISDTGCGMPPDVIERAFDPFFTTKPEGEGTGLGLSMVYGFTKQSGGHVKIYSEPGHGTTIKLYLPRAMQTEAVVPEVPAGPVEGGTETILVVEDDAQVRETVVEMLTDLGYRVLKAQDGQSALIILQSGIPVDLLFTDVVMPGPVRSPELARQAKALLPDIEVLFTSGYTENAIVHGGRLDPGVKLLSKPYRREDLARKIRHMLRNREQRLLAQQAAEASRVPSSLAAVDQSEGLRILLVEDDQDIRQAAHDLILELGHEATACDNAEDALEILAAQPFDLLFTDISLPGISGLELAGEALTLQPSLSVIVASGYGNVGKAGERSGDYIYLPKPYDLNELEQVLQRVREEKTESTVVTDA